MQNPSSEATGGLRTCLPQISVTRCCHRTFFLWSRAGLPLRGTSQQGSSATSCGQAAEASGDGRPASHVSAL